MPFPTSCLSFHGDIVMPVQPAFCAKNWRMMNDRFGTPWIVNGEMLD